MRFTSSARKTVAGVLCVLLLAVTGRAPAPAAEPPAPALLLVFHGADIPAEVARGRREALSRRLLADLRVDWLPTPVQPGSSGKIPDPPDADGASLERIQAMLGEAVRHMERMETLEAGAVLDAAEREARSFRPAESLRPFLADIFLRRGLLLLWAGNRAGAEEMFGRVRVLRPDFEPDPGMFSPSVREAWSRATARPPAGAEILVQSIPAGADVFVGGTRAGATPARVRVPALTRVVVRVVRRGYLPIELSGHWLPGDSEMRDVTLTRDRLSRLEELVAADGGKEAGAILDEMAREAGASRVAVIVLTSRGPGSAVRILSLARGDEAPAPAGGFTWPDEEDATDEAGARAASLLVAAGWPAVSGDTRVAAPWYHKWWFWAVLGAAIAGAVAGAGGGGGGSDGSTGAIGVDF